VRLYRTLDPLRAGLPAALAGGPRVLKQNRGNGGQGIWKVEGCVDGLTVLEARRGSLPESIGFDAFMARCAAYFENGGQMIDQAFQPRLPEGMTRVYLARDRVAGFGHQLIKALATPPPGAEPEEPGPRIMHAPGAPAFQALRRNLEDDWIPGLCERLELTVDQLPVLWDADFLLGPKASDGVDSHVLCEINVSSVAPFPPSAAVPVAEAALSGVRAFRNRLEQDRAAAPR
jgi:hypothetical protein